VALVDYSVEGPVAWPTPDAPPARASLAVGLMKRACQTGAEVGPDQGPALERQLQQRLVQSADAREGLAAHDEKRRPEFRGE
jgi:enoyl-CoA hydratase